MRYNKIIPVARFCALVAFSGLALSGLKAGPVYKLHSPDKKLELTISLDSVVRYELRHDRKVVVEPSAISMTMADGTVWGKDPRVTGQSERQVSENVYPVSGKFSVIPDRYKELKLQMAGNYSLYFRLYDDGMAYRFEGNRQAADSVTVMSERATFRLADDPKMILGETQNLTAWEVSNVVYESVSAAKPGTYGITPTVFDNGRKDLRVVVAEADLNDYPGMYLRKDDDTAMSGYWAACPKEVVMGSWGDFVTVVKDRYPYLARTAGDHLFPWRVVIVAQDDRKLLTNEMIYLLAKPQQVAETSWIRPGKATWEWWHCAILENAPFESGHQKLSTQMYKYYIDFAAENKLEYLLIDAGWSNLFRPNELNPNVDVKEIIRYGKEKNVGIWLWTVASTLIHHPHQYLDSISSWGAAGVKIDFFDRDDQLIMREYENLAKACADRKLMVDFHGCSKPTGLHRAYPNILTYEAMRCNECSKWDTSSNPDYRMQCIFGRMLAGAIDYTPGSMRNATRECFKPIDPGLPMSLGTRCHELAMYVVFDSQFTMLCDSPDEYRKYPDILSYLSSVPVSFDDTRALSAKMGEHALLAKKKGDEWYVSGMTNWNERSQEIDFSFLPAGVTYTAEIFRDGKDAAVNANDYVYETKTVDSKTKMNVWMAPGGGVVMRVFPAH